MTLLSMMEPAERGAKYRYRCAVIVIVALASLGLFLCLAISLPWWVGFPAGIAMLAAGFLLLLKLVNIIVPKKLPTDEDF